MQDRTPAANAPALRRLAGVTAILGALTMLAGAALWATSGTDLWAALDTGDMAGYLEAAAGVRGMLVANLTLWILGVLILGTALQAMARLSTRRPAAAHAASVATGAAVPLAIVSFLAMMALAVRIAPETTPTAVAVADVVGWVGARSDDLATAILVGLTPALLAVSARKDWMPGWLVAWGYVAGFVGLVSLAVLFMSVPAGIGFLIVPVGIGWMIAAGVVLLGARGVTSS